MKVFESFDAAREWFGAGTVGAWLCDKLEAGEKVSTAELCQRMGVPVYEGTLTETIAEHWKRIIKVQCPSPSPNTSEND
jgi:hypothetical protein